MEDDYEIWRSYGRIVLGGTMTVLALGFLFLSTWTLPWCVLPKGMSFDWQSGLSLSGLIFLTMHMFIAMIVSFLVSLHNGSLFGVEIPTNKQFDCVSRTLVAAGVLVAFLISVPLGIASCQNVYQDETSSNAAWVSDSNTAMDLACEYAGVSGFLLTALLFVAEAIAGSIGWLGWVPYRRARAATRARFSSLGRELA